MQEPSARTVKSDLYFEILKRFRAAGVVVPAAARNGLWVHNVEDKPASPGKP